MYWYKCSGDRYINLDRVHNVSVIKEWDDNYGTVYADDVPVLIKANRVEINAFFDLLERINITIK
jgi:hypothetical protein